jgi:hypothetical protein
MTWTPAKTWAGAVLIVASALAYYALTWKTFTAFNLAIDHCAHPFCDFYGNYYPMAQQIFWRNIPSPGFFYSPFFAIVLSVFKPLDLNAALVVWGAVQVVLAAILALAPRLFGMRSASWSLLGLFLVVTAFPVLHNFKWGQVSVLLVLSLMACFLLYERGRTAWAAGFLAFAISIKFFPAFFLVYFLLRRDWRFLLAAVGMSVLFMAVVPVVLLGAGDTLRFYRVLHETLGLAQNHLFDPNSQYLPNALRRWWVAVSYDGSVAYPALLQESLRFETPMRLAGYVVAANSVWLLFRMIRLPALLEELGRGASTWAFVVLCLALPLIVYTSWPHYFVYLPFCQVFLWREIARGGAPVRRRAMKIGLLVVPSIIGSSVILFNVLAGSRFNLEGAFRARSIYAFWGCLVVADALLLLASHLELGGRIQRAKEALSPEA